MQLLILVLGDRKSIRQIADELEEVYGKKPRLSRRGSRRFVHNDAGNL